MLRWHSQKKKKRNQKRKKITLATITQHWNVERKWLKEKKIYITERKKQTGWEKNGHQLPW